MPSIRELDSYDRALLPAIPEDKLFVEGVRTELIMQEHQLVGGCRCGAIRYKGIGLMRQSADELRLRTYAMAADIEISTDPNRLDVSLIHQFLSQSYWAEGRSISVVEKSIRHSLCFGAYIQNEQVGFARVITDRAVFAYLADVFVVPEYRGMGIARRVLEAILAHPDMEDIRLFRLGTRDAHGLYEKYGFTSVRPDGKSMELFLDVGE